MQSNVEAVFGSGRRPHDLLGFERIMRATARSLRFPHVKAPVNGLSIGDDATVWYSGQPIGFNMTRKSTMSLIVCKFGGTSVASPERIQMVAKKLIAKKQAGHQVVAVVSAMGKTTDELVGLAASLNDNPPAREMDRLLSTGEQVSMTLLAMAIEARGTRP